VWYYDNKIIRSNKIKLVASTTLIIRFTGLILTMTTVDTTIEDVINKVCNQLIMPIIGKDSKINNLDILKFFGHKFSQQEMRPME
jgi:hypothetical protein